MASLTERITQATTSEEIESLLKKGEGYECAESKTRFKWKRAADKRMESFHNKEEKTKENKKGK